MREEAWSSVDRGPIFVPAVMFDEENAPVSFSHLYEHMTRYEFASEFDFFVHDEDVRPGCTPSPLSDLRSYSTIVVFIPFERSISWPRV